MSRFVGLSRSLGRGLMGGRGRPAYDALTRFAPRLLGNRIWTGPGAGLRFEGGDTLGYALGVSEPAVQAALAQYLSSGSVFFDVGAHAGFLTVLACRLVGPQGRVCAFEPVPANVAVLRAKLARNAFTNATVHEVALTNRDAQVRMAGGVRHITAKIDAAGDLLVPGRAADDMDLPAPTLVKIDVEGAEPQVLEGMARTIARHRPVLVVEIHGGCRPAIEGFFRRAGYDGRELADGGMVHLLALPA